MKVKGSLTAVLLLVTSVVSAKSTNIDEGFISPELNASMAAIPFETYGAWLENIKNNAKNAAMTDKWQKHIEPKAFNRLQANTDSFWMDYQSDGLKISGAIAYPTNTEAKKLPVVIYNRGGNDRHNVNRIMLYSTLLPIAEQGYLVLASNYRGSKNSEGRDEFGGNDLNDVLRLIEISKSIPNADASKIAVIGASRGGMMTWQMLRKNKTDIDTAIIIAGNVDEFSAIKRRPEMERLMKRMIPDFENNKQAELTKRSSIFWMDELNKNVPILLLHGTEDVRVSYENSDNAAKRLTELGHPHRLVAYPDGDHALTFYRDEMLSDIYQWLNKHLN